MIKESHKTQIDLYSYVNEMRNVVWLAGYARDISRENNRVKSMLIQQTNNRNLALPVVFGPDARLRPGFSETYPIKVTCHVFGRRLENGERVAELRVIDTETPTLLDMPGPNTWEKVVPPGAPVDAFRPIDRNSDPNAKAANLVRIAGLVYSVGMATDSSGREQNDCLVILLRQHADADKAIPVRVYGKYARTYLNRLVPGAAVLFTGEFRVRVKVLQKATKEGDLDVVEKYPYVHASHVRVVDRDEIRVMPQWATDQVERLMKLRQGVARDPNSVDAATNGRPRVIVSNTTPPVVEVAASSEVIPDLGGGLG